MVNFHWTKRWPYKRARLYIDLAEKLPKMFKVKTNSVDRVDITLETEQWVKQAALARDSRSAHFFHLLCDIHPIHTEIPFFFILIGLYLCPRLLCEIQQQQIYTNNSFSSSYPRSWCPTSPRRSPAAPSLKSGPPRRSPARRWVNIKAGNSNYLHS